MERARWYGSQLEHGQIVLFDDIPFDLAEDEIEFLTSRRADSSRIHKNISYRPGQDVLRGFTSSHTEETTRLHQIMRRYSVQVTQFLSQFLSPYAEHWSLDFASFRPLEERGRNLPLHKRNDLLHVDAFPSRPTHGARILRVFTNINPTEARVWLTTMRFGTLAARFAADAGLSQFAARASSTTGSLRRQTSRFMRTLGLPVANRSTYD